MSNRAQAWAWEQQGLSTSEKYVLVAMGDNASEDGECWPGHRFIARKTGLSRTTIRKAINSLEEKGRVTVTQRQRAKNGSQTSNLYTLRIGGTDLAQGGTHLSQGGPVGDPPEPSFNQSSNIPLSRRTVTAVTTVTSATEEAAGPHWYSILSDIPGFQKPLAEINGWMEERGITEEIAEVVAYGLADWWEQKQPKRRNPWLTFANWCIRDKGGGKQNGRKPSQHIWKNNETPQHSGGFIRPR